MSSIEELVKVIDKKKVIAALDAGDNPANFTTKKGKIKRAKEDLKELYLEYRKEIQDRALFIIATGTQAQKLADIAEKEFFCYQLNSDGFYNSLVDGVNERLYTNAPASRALFDLIGSEFEERAADIGVIGYKALIFESKYKKVLTGREDALALIKTAFNDKVGSEMLGLDAIEKVTKQAINSEDAEKKVLTKFPIVMVTEDESLVKELAKGLRYITGNVFIVGAGTVKDKDVKDNCISTIKTVGKEAIEKSLVTINKNSK